MHGTSQPTGKRKILMVLSGPVFEISPWMRQKFEAMSARFEGNAFTSMPEPLELQVASITVRAVKVSRKTRLLGNLKYYAFALRTAYALRRAGNAPELITSYDPLKTGLLASMIKAITGAKFICEVNGVYHAPKNYLDEGWFGARIKLFIYPIIMRHVLARADGIKIQYASQIDPFKPVLRDPVIRIFFNQVSFEKMKFIEERKEVLFVGFPFRRKGVDILIDAFKRVAPKFPDWKLKILGWFPDMTELNAAMDGHPQIYHHLPVYNHEMPDHIGRCAFLVLPSRSEAGGRVLLESMAASKPRLGADVDGIHKLIDDGVDGLLFKAEDVADCAAKLEMLMGDDAMRARMGAAGSERVRKDFNSERYRELLFSFYEEVLAKPR
jgi:glycosyltransferase involved in cell wall biosynthesis